MNPKKRWLNVKKTKNPKKRWLNVKKTKPWTIPSDRVKFPYGAVELEDSTDSTRGTHPPSEVTQPEKIYDINSTSRSDHSNTFPGKEDGYWPISTSCLKIKKDLKKRT